VFIPHIIVLKQLPLKKPLHFFTAILGIYEVCNLVIKIIGVNFMGKISNFIARTTEKVRENTTFRRMGDQHLSQLSADAKKSCDSALTQMKTAEIPSGSLLKAYLLK
jgi:hypothetical protein